ncbi:hypothetical protein RM543_02890 [Roseicyclus sp. F158]|uniref:Uncharacterized protein n=1 Tax=Tropicimonas omnivorans TaxID=3075590 RepID=A0ABU3DD40_9RHOB|nr:hypothetical protein [Roseicyclus sp. F158]MDT0681618.1 hypothetical protein [Roseicyclus sp. F158]
MKQLHTSDTTELMKADELPREALAIVEELKLPEGRMTIGSLEMHSRRLFPIG